MSALSQSFFRCESNAVFPASDSFDEPVNFRSVEYKWFLHEIDENGETIADVEDEAILLTWDSFNSIENNMLLIGSQSTFALEEDRSYKVHIYFLGYTVDEVYFGEEELVLREGEGRRADLSPYSEGLTLYHADEFWFYPDVLVNKGCTEEGEPVYETETVDWDGDSSIHIVCELFKAGEREEGAIAKSQFGSCVFTEDAFDPDSIYEMDVSVNFDGDSEFEQVQTITMRTQDVQAICKIEGSQAYSLNSGEELEYNVVF